VYNSKKSLYLSRIAAIQPVDKNVDNPGFPVDGLWISAELSTGQSCPQFYPQVYPQILPLLSTGLSTGIPTIKRYNLPELLFRRRFYPQFGKVIHNFCG
jgi:hypothetical protein